MRFHPEVQHHRTTTLPGQEEFVRMSPDVRLLPDWNVVLNCVTTFLYYNVWDMPRHAPVLECSAEDKASLIATSKSRAEESRAVERARIILARLEGKEIQQVA